MRSFEHSQSVAELLGAAPVESAPTSDDLRLIRSVLEADLAEVTAGWSARPDGPLRLTKGRLRSTAICPAQVLAEADPFSLDSDVALGAICDIASGIVAVHPTYRPSTTWIADLRPALEAERPDVVEFVDRLAGDQLEVFVETVEERCQHLAPLIGDVRNATLTVRERARVLFGEANVLLTGETDIAVRDGQSVIVEVKSGSFGPWVVGELRHYALVRALRDLRAPAFGCAITLADGRMTPTPIRLEELHAAARQIVAAAEVLVEIDQCVVGGRPVRTQPGDHCRWCRRARVCPDVSDQVLDDLPVSIQVELNPEGRS